MSRLHGFLLSVSVGLIFFALVPATAHAEGALLRTADGYLFPHGVGLGEGTPNDANLATFISPVENNFYRWWNYCWQVPPNSINAFTVCWIRNVYSWRFATITSKVAGSAIAQREYSNSDDQHWKVWDGPKGSKVLMNVRSGYCLTSHRFPNGFWWGGTVTLENCSFPNVTPNQQWISSVPGWFDPGHH